MATNEPEDRIAEERERQLQLALTAAAIAVQRVVAARREALLEAERQSEVRAQALRAELAREQAMAQAQIQAVFDQAWWEQATPRDVASIWEQAAQWQEQASPGSAPTFHDATERINSEVSERCGVDVAELVALVELGEQRQPWGRAEDLVELGGVGDERRSVAAVVITRPVLEPCRSPRQR